MKDKPWQDIYSLEAWNEILEDYCSQKRDAKGSPDKLWKFKRHLDVPFELTQITQQMEVYSRTPKASLGNLLPRIRMLDTISMLGQTYLTKYSLPLKPKPKNDNDEPEKEDLRHSLNYAVAKLGHESVDDFPHLLRRGKTGPS